MLFTEYLLLVILSAIWGASFIFMRILAPVLGPIMTADMRLLIAGVALALFLKAQNINLEWKRNWKRYIIIGMLSSGISFLLFSFAALHLPASISVILNALTPMFGALSAVVWLGEKMSWRLVVGIVLGFIGVAVIRGGGNVEITGMTTIAIGACVLATMFYGIGSVYVKLKAHDIGAQAIATGSQLTVGMLFLPLIVISPPPGEITLEIALYTLLFALLCSAVAYIIFYRLIKTLGPVKTTTVTFLIPVFGFVWGTIFLQEIITFKMILGALIVLSGMYFVTRKKKF